MSNYTYTIYAGASNTAPNFTTINGAVADFVANNRCGAGTGTIGASDVLTFKIQGNQNFGSSSQVISGLTVTDGGQIIVDADTNPFNASSANTLGWSASYDGMQFGTAAIFQINQKNWIVRNLMISSGQGGASNSPFEGTGTASYPGLVLNCCIRNTEATTYYATCCALNNANLRNCVLIQRGDNSAGGLRAIRYESSGTIEHCTIVNLATAAGTSYGIYQNAGTSITVKNTYVGGYSSFGSFTDSGSTGNACSGTATGTNGINSVALSTTNFEGVTWGSENLKAKSTSVLKTTGATRLGAVLTDIFAQNRADPATVGAFEYSAPAAAVLSAPTATATGATTGTVGCTSDTASGTLYVVVTTSATQPSAAQIKAGTDHADAAAAYSSSDASVTAGANTFDATGLTSGLTYFAHFVQNANSADSDVLSTSAFYPGTYRTGSDITVTGWTVTGAATHAAARNENSASDSEYSTSPTLSGTPVSIIMGLAQEMPAGSYTVKYRCRLTTGTGYAKLTFMDGSNVSQGTTQDIAITSSFTTYDASVTLTGAAVRVKEELWI